MTYSEVTHDVKIQVRPIFMETESDLITGKYVFAYFITIENLSDEKIQLLRRHWEINDSAGESYVVDGDGVVGRQPIITPRRSHSYNSYCVLKSMVGSMEGYYEMMRPNGEIIQVKIPKFLLRSHLLN